MKLLALLFSLLALSWLQTANSTHLETCECHEINDLVNTTVQGALASLEDRLRNLLFGNNTTNHHDLDRLEIKLATTMKELLKPIQRQLDYHLPPPPLSELGTTRDKPAVSCKDLREKHAQAPSGYYWIKQSGSPVRVYCSMSGCGSDTGGWMRVANIDMRNTSQSCPNGLSLTAFNSKRLCDNNMNGCRSIRFSLQGLRYSKVCGKIIAYQKSTPIAFHRASNGIDRDYVYGVSLTHGQNPRKHIWTFAGASDETTSYYNFKCPCINSALTASRVPNFVGNDYFCDTALSRRYNGVPNSDSSRTSDPLWDGRGCGPANTCCTFNTPPWFVKNLSSSTTDNIEMRLCRPDGSGSTPLEIVELYVQ